MWIGLGQATVDGIRKSVGSFGKVREIVLMPKQDWEDGIAQASVTVTGDETRKLNALEKGQAGSLRSIARLLVGLSADEGSAPTSSSNEVKAVPKPSERRIKMSTVIDQGDDTEIAALDQTEVRKLFETFKGTNDDLEVSSDEKCDGTPLQAVRSKLLADVVPYADFGVFRPYGQRFARAMKLKAQIWVPERGTYVPTEMPGPANFRE